MFNYGIAPGGGYAYQMPVNGYSANQPQYYSQPTTYRSPTTSGWVQPQYTPVQSSGFTNYQTPNVSYSQPVNQGWVPVQNTGWYNTPQQSYQQSYQHSHNHGYQHSHGYTNGYNMPYMGGGGGCGNCGSSVPMIRRDW